MNSTEFVENTLPVEFVFNELLLCTMVHVFLLSERIFT